MSGRITQQGFEWAILTNNNTRTTQMGFEWAILTNNNTRTTQMGFEFAYVRGGKIAKRSFAVLIG